MPCTTTNGLSGLVNGIHSEAELPELPQRPLRQTLLSDYYNYVRFRNPQPQRPLTALFQGQRRLRQRNFPINFNQVVQHKQQNRQVSRPLANYRLYLSLSTGLPRKQFLDDIHLISQAERARKSTSKFGDYIYIEPLIRQAHWARKSLRQTRINHWLAPLVPPAQHPIAYSLLNLPRHIFRMIMHHVSADLTRDCAFLLNKRVSIKRLMNNNDDQEWEGIQSNHIAHCRFDSWLEMCPNDLTGERHPIDSAGRPMECEKCRAPCECGPLGNRFVELITCCRAFWLELRPIFFAKNSFVVHRCAHGGMLKPLQTLGWTGLANLTSLRLVVNSTISNYPHNDPAVVRFRGKWRRRKCKCFCNEPCPNDHYPYEYCVCDVPDPPFLRHDTGG